MASMNGANMFTVGTVKKQVGEASEGTVGGRAGSGWYQKALQ